MRDPGNEVVAIVVWLLSISISVRNQIISLDTVFSVISNELEVPWTSPSRPSTIYDTFYTKLAKIDLDYDQPAWIEKECKMLNV